MFYEEHVVKSCSMSRQSDLSSRSILWNTRRGTLQKYLLSLYIPVYRLIYSLSRHLPHIECKLWIVDRGVSPDFRLTKDRIIDSWFLVKGLFVEYMNHFGESGRWFTLHILYWPTMQYG